MEGPFSATGVSKDGLCLVDSTVSTCYPNYKTVHRRFQFWCHSEVLRQVLTDVANELRDKGVVPTANQTRTRSSKIWPCRQPQ